MKADFPQFYPPLYDLKHKVGRGGLSDDMIQKAQSVIDNNDTDFIEMVAPYMVIFQEGITMAEKGQVKNKEERLENILFPAMQLKANGTLFHYPIVTKVATKLLWFLERIDELNAHALEIVNAFASSIDVIFKKKLKGKIMKDGEDILQELEQVCDRFFEKYPDNIHERFKGEFPQ